MRGSQEEPSEGLLEFAEALSKRLINEHEDVESWVADCLEEFVRKQHAAFSDLMKDLFHPVFAYMEDYVKREGALPSTLSHEDQLAAWEIEQRAKRALWYGTPFLALVAQWMSETLDEQVRPYLCSSQDWKIFSWKQIGRWYNLTGEGVRKRFKFVDDDDLGVLLAGMRGDLWSSEAFSRWQIKHLMATEEGVSRMEDILFRDESVNDDSDISSNGDEQRSEDG